MDETNDMAEEKIKILLVEDNYMNQVLVTEILELNGYEVVDAKTGTDAIKLFNETRPDLVLMDLHLPGMDGVTATRIIKADVANKNVPILALTASGMEGEEDTILSKGFDGYVSKPIDVQRLLNAITEGLANRDC